MVVEERPLALTPGEKLGRYRSLLRRHGVVRTVNKLLYNWVTTRLARRTADAGPLFPPESSTQYARAVPTIIVPSVNDDRCVEALQSWRSDVIAVCGTTVIKPRVFRMAGRWTLNIHTGITPEYRSADPVFWALYNGEPENVGVTIHLVDEGIDTGPVIYQQRVPVYSSDTLASVSARCVRTGGRLYLRALDDMRRGMLRLQDRREVAGRSYRSIQLGIAQYLRFRWRFGRLKRRLPAAPAGGASPGEVPR